MNKTLTLPMIVLVASALVVSTFALLTTQWHTQSSALVATANLNAYWDQQCNNKISSIDFGLLEAGSQKDITFYLRNEGNTDLTLNMTSNNWNPTEAASYASLTWDREGQQINPNQVISCVITLSVSSNIQDISSFTLTITITGTV